MNNSVFRKTTENIRKHRDMKFLITNKRRNYLASEPNYHTTKCFSENMVAMEMYKVSVKMNKPIYLDLSILDLCLRAMYEYWFLLCKIKVWRQC